MRQRPCKFNKIAVGRIKLLKFVGRIVKWTEKTRHYGLNVTIGHPPCWFKLIDHVCTTHYEKNETLVYQIFRFIK